MDKRFTDIIQLIKISRVKAVNAELINLYWNIGEYISKKIGQSEWGDSIVVELAKYIQQNEPEIKGFSDKNIWRMKQFTRLTRTSQNSQHCREKLAGRTIWQYFQDVRPLKKGDFT